MPNSELYGGRLADDGLDTADSLAGYLESAFEQVRAEAGLDPLPEDGRRDRLTFMLGIARGVVAYLADNGDALPIPADHDASHTHSVTPDHDGPHTHNQSQWPAHGPAHDHDGNVSPDHGDAHRHGEHVEVAARFP